MKTGEMRDRITILKLKNQTGSVIELDNVKRYEDYADIWAKVEYLRGQEYFAAQAINASNIIRFIVHYRTDLDTTMAIVHNNNLFDIEAVYPLDNTRTWLVIMAKGVDYSV